MIVMKLLLIFLSSLFLEANTCYTEGNFTEAAKKYEQSVAEQPSAEAYYNLGNTYFKLYEQDSLQGNMAKSIIAYERALRIDPSNEDVQYNLDYVKSKIQGKIKDSESFFLSDWLKSMRDTMVQQTWTWISIGLFIFMLVGVFLFAYSKTLWLRKTAFYCSILALVISVFACLNAASLHNRDSQRAEAIVVKGEVIVKSSPAESGTDLFPLYEGVKVIIDNDQIIDEWCCVRVGNHKGWMRLKDLERI
jgi:tetratricopeptide (TPR) repeat protein